MCWNILLSYQNVLLLSTISFGGGGGMSLILYSLVARDMSDPGSSVYSARFIVIWDEKHCSESGKAGT